ncbi:MAG: hypothetical protein GF393_12945 [Armatimonadia bacterium]|nr:hypothetical protein [Armatimonadia bacterium]
MSSLKTKLFGSTVESPPKIFFFDVETTGTDPNFHEIIQFAGILDINKETVWEFNKIIRPEYPCRIHPDATKTHGITIDQLQKGIKYDELHYRIVKHLSFHIDKYNPNDKAFPCAFNGSFDYSFLSSLWSRCNDVFLGSLFNHKIIDPLALFRFLSAKYEWTLENMKLSTIANALNIPINAHDAMSDTKVLREITYTILGNLV